MVKKYKRANRLALHRRQHPAHREAAAQIVGTGNDV
jgi:hypothetical protein